MADRLATPLGNKSKILVSEELLVAQDDIRSIGKSVDTLLMELDQQALEAYLSSASEGSATGRARRTSKTRSPKLSPEHAANTSSAKQSPEAIGPRYGDFLVVIGGSPLPVKRHRNTEQRQRRRERRQLKAATAAPSSPLDLSRVSYDKCVASLQSRPSPIQADDKLDIEHNWTSMHMNSDGDAPIIEHTHKHIRTAQRTNCKNSRPNQANGPMHASTAGHARVDARISGQRDARVRAWAPCVYPLHASIGDDQVSQSHFDQQLQHSNVSKCSRGGTWHASNQPKRTRQPQRTHPTSREMNASGALKARRMHLLAPKDARVLHGIHASGGDAYLLPSKSSATGGSTPLRTNAGGSILPKIDPGGSVLSEVNTGGSTSPATYEHVRSTLQGPSAKRRSIPTRCKSSQAHAVQHDPFASPVPDLRDQLNKKRSADRATPYCCHFPQGVGGPSPPVKCNRNTKRRQHHYERRLQAIAIIVPTFPLDLSCVSFDKCASSVHSRHGSVRAEEKLGQAHIQIAASTNHVRDALIMGDSMQQTNALKKLSLKDNALEPKLKSVHLLQDLHAPGACISHKGHVRIHEWPKHVSKLRSSDRGAHESHSNFNNGPHHTTVMDISEDVFTSCNGASKSVLHPRRVHLLLEKICAPNARNSWCTHHSTAEIHASGASKHGPIRPALPSCASTLVHLSLLPSISAMGGSVPPRTKVGGSAAPRTYQYPQPAHHVHPARRSKRWRRKLISACTLSQPESSASSMMDLWNQLKREGGINHITPHWQSKQIIASAPDDCTCLPPAKAKSMTEHTSNSSSSKLAKQLHFRKEDATSIDEYPELSVNMVERDTGKHPASNPENSATPGVYMGTRSRSGVARPVNYRTFVQELDMPKEQSIIEKFQSSSFLIERPIPSFVANAPKEVARQLALQAQAQQEQQQQLRAHAHSIDLLKLMLQQVLKQVSKKKSKHASSTNHSKDKENSILDSSVRSHSPHE